MRSSRMGRTKAILPAATWVGIFLMPLLITLLEGIHKPFEWYAANFLLTCSICIMFYIDFYLLIDRYIMKHQWGKFIAINIAIGVALGQVDYLGTGMLLRRYDIDGALLLSSNSLSFIAVSSVLMFLAASLSVSIRMTEYSYNSNIKLADAKKVQAEAELANLKSQLNPHFLFNTLNNIYALISVDSESAKEAVHDLSHLLRYVIYDTSPNKVPLKGEMIFLKEYVRIEQIRLGSDFDLSIQVPPDCGDKQIAPMLFLPLVENAFKHGISHSKPSFIHIDIQLDGERLVCRIENSNHAKSNADGGVGIANTTRRLNIIYPGRYSLNQSGNEATFLTLLNVDLQP